jgi:hypothetical protein
MILIIASVATALLTVGIVYSPIGKFFSFVPIPAWLLAMIIGIICAYFVLTEAVLLVYYRYVQKEVI